MPYRSSLHSLVDMLADFGTFEGRTVAIEVINGVDIRLGIAPPLQGGIGGEVVVRARRIIERPMSIAEAIDGPDNEPASPAEGRAFSLVGKCH